MNGITLKSQIVTLGGLKHLSKAIVPNTTLNAVPSSNGDLEQCGTRGQLRGPIVLLSRPLPALQPCW